ncbi:MAG: Asp-tRNA(Asn)/Glu-tRNA(Gln) amidotransferase subunit GatB [Candidatus Eremiobacteraeota bacterium]|nr:Asp-tRNA(Asn)/Glu-tRNA(Gln) amidotransferase subunit GatB [Candidatus Eremiobacteraeota bacterium]
MEFEPVIGLEIHVELGTKTKLFCGCLNRFNQAPNSQICPVCLGLPGTLPSVNRQAVALLIKTGLALNCSIPLKSKFDRKNYFYPDMPKNYQISQYDSPFAAEGKLDLWIDGVKKTVEIQRIHLEEDTGKSIHVSTSNSQGEKRADSERSVILDRAMNLERAMIGSRISDADYTLLDYNRAGVPLMEIVTKPDLRSPEEAVLFLQKLRLIVQTLEVSDCKMEEGQMRCDANVSLREKGSKAFGEKVEIKNMNSFKSIRDALHHEIERQREKLLKGEKVYQETRGWDETRKITFVMRSKEYAHDYRYFPEPDLPSYEISPQWLNEVKTSLPELPDEKERRYKEKYLLSDEEVQILLGNLTLAKFFDEAAAWGGNPKEICIWIKGDISKYLNEKKCDLTKTKLTPGLLVELIGFIEKGIINGKTAKELLPEILEKGVPSSLESTIQSRGLGQISDLDSLKKILDEILEKPESQKAVEEYRNGNERAFGFLVGEVMKKTKGKANPQIANQLLKEMFKNM